MTNTLTTTRPATTVAGDAPTARRAPSLRDRVRARRAHRVAVAGTVTAYPATRGVGVVVLPR